MKCTKILKKNSWRYVGDYRLIDARRERSGKRYVFKFILLPEKIEEISEGEIEEAFTKKEHYLIREILVSESKELAPKRNGQDVLRKHVLSNYSSKCAMCEINDHYLLRASHIIPWSEDKSKRGILENVICLCVLHDALFEKRTITVSGGYEIEFSTEFLTRCKTSITYSKIMEITFQKLRLPDILPNPNEELLIAHKQKFVSKG